MRGRLSSVIRVFLVVLMCLGFSYNVSAHSGIGVIVKDGCGNWYLAIGVWHSGTEVQNAVSSSNTGIYIDMNQNGALAGCCLGGGSEFYTFTDHTSPVVFNTPWSSVTNGSTELVNLENYFNTNIAYNPTVGTTPFSASVVWAPGCSGRMRLRSWLILKLPSGLQAGVDYLCQTSNTSVVEKSCTPGDQFSIRYESPIEVTGDDFLCLGDSLELATSANPSLIWYKDGSVIKGPSPDSLLTVYTGGNYTVKKGGAGCTGEVSDDFRVYSPKSLDLGPNEIICVGDSLLLDAGQGNSFLWSTGAVSRFIHTKEDTVTILRSDTLTCTSRDTIVVVEASLPTPNLGSDTAICSYSSINLSLPKTYVAYNWNTGEADPTKELLFPGDQYQGLDSSLIRVQVTDTNNCLGSDSIMVYSHPRPRVKPRRINNSQCLNINSFDLLDSSEISFGSIAAYGWYLDNNLISTSKDTMNLTFSVADTFSYKQSVESGFGCKDTSQPLDIFVRPMPVVQFVTDTATLCERGNVFAIDYQGSISAGTMSKLWSYGDGVTSTTAEDTLKTYATFGAYPVRLEVISDFDCRDTVEQTLTVFAQPNAQFSIDDSLECYRDHEIVAINNSTLGQGAVQTRTWSTAGVDFLNIDTLRQTYASANDYTIQLKIESDKGCFDSLTKAVSIHTMPVAQISVDTTEKCEENHLFNFVNTSAISNGTFNHRWAFGDDSTSTLAVPSKKYLDHGVYDLQYVATSGFGCADSVDILLVVHPQPRVSFIPSDVELCMKGNVFSFNNTTVMDTGKVAAHSWNVDHVETSTADSFLNYISPSLGVYRISLIETSTKNCVDSSSVTIEVYPQNSIDFNLSDTMECLRGNSIIVSDNSMIPYSAITSKIATLGDGSRVGLTNDTLRHSFAVAGVYTITYFTETENTCKDTIQKVIEIKPHPETRFIVNQDSQCFNQHIFEYTNSSSIANGTIANTVWNVIDVDTFFNQPQLSNLVYASPGMKSIELVTTSDFGCLDSLTKVVRVYASPQNSIALDRADSCLNSNSFDFNGFSGITEGSVVAHQWDLGEGKVAVASNPGVISYLLDTTIQVSYTVTSDNGCADTAYRTITIHSNPVVDFIINNDTQCLNGNLFAMTNMVTIKNGSIANCNWSFDDGFTSSLTNPMAISYVTTRGKQMSFEAVSNNGCRDTMLKDVFVNPMPEAQFAMDEVCLNQMTNFDNLSKVEFGTMTSRWSFGDGNTSDQESPNYRYSRADSFDVSLIVRTDRNCFDTIRMAKAAVIHPVPLASFSHQKVNSWEKQTTYLFSNSSIGGEFLTWEINGIQEGFDEDLEFLFQDSGTRKVSLIASNQYNCSDTADLALSVFPDLDYFIPTAFSPNGDNLNDVYNLAALGYVDMFSLTIANRWGEILFKSNDSNIGWDGTYKGELVQNGSYVFIVNFRDIGTSRQVFEDGIVHVVR
jgi:gliding motility-associated-like protein